MPILQESVISVSCASIPQPILISLFDTSVITMQVPQLHTGKPMYNEPFTERAYLPVYGYVIMNRALIVML